MSRAGHNCQPACDERRLAEDEGEFVYVPGLGGWCFLDEPKRRPATALMVRYAYGKIDKLPETRGIPYSRDTCPWCGGDLVPPVADDMDDGC